MPKATYTFEQVEHLVGLAKQKGVTGDGLQDHFDAGILSDVFEVADPKKLDRDAVRKALGLAPLNLPLLVPVGTITIPALAGRFSAREKFALNYGLGAKPGVRIAYLGNNFQNWFGDAVEKPVVEVSLNYARLTRSELDGPILALFGNRPDLAVLIRQIYWLMEQQPNGESGTLLNNGRVNIFYMLGLTREVYLYWDSGHSGWIVDAPEVTYPYRWDDGSQVFSRNSCAPVTA